MRLYIVEGTPAEVVEAAKGLRSDSGVKAFMEEAAQEVTPPTLPMKTTDGPDRFVTVEFARELLERRPISPPMRGVLVVLSEAGEQWTPSANLYRASGYSVAQFSGLMGAFGRRMSHTKGFDDEAHFFDFRWDEALQAWEYRLPATIRAVVQAWLAS